MYATNYFEALMLRLLRGQNITAPATMYLALFPGNPSDTGTGVDEIIYSGYQRQPVTFAEPTASGSGMMIQNVGTITFPESSTSAGTVTYVGLYGSLTGGNMWLYGQLNSPLVIQNGVSPVFREGSIRWIWTGNFTTYYKTAIMNIMRGSNCSGFTPYIGLLNGSAEFSGNGYSRRPAYFLQEPEQQTSGTCLTYNTNEIITAAATGTWGTLNTVAVYDSETEGNAFAIITLSTSYNVTSGYQVGFHVGALQISVN